VTQRGAGLAAIVLGAGLGKRMRSALPKVLHPVGGRPMILRVAAAARDAGVSRAVVVTGSGAEAVESTIRTAEGSLAPLAVSCTRQEQQMGTGHAVMQALPLVREETVLVLPGDTPLLQADELRALIQAHQAAGAGITLLTARMPDPTGYGRILRDAHGQIAAIVEERDATPEQRAVNEVFTLVGCFQRDLLASALQECGTNNAQREVYLPDTVAISRAWGQRVEAVISARAADVLGVNDRRALAEAEAVLRRRTLDRGRGGPHRVRHHPPAAHGDRGRLRHRPSL
jgi:bifunctional UDP-N-acetylglucosamine pyrophosphorylase/glucosamine-1-phosphate N-acetyltransferase